MEFEKYFDEEELHEILRIARELRLEGSRQVLLSSLPSSFVSGLYNVPTPDGQLVTDLDRLQECFCLEKTGSEFVIPFVVWLRRAADLNRAFPAAKELLAYADKAEAVYTLHAKNFHGGHQTRIRTRLREILRLFYMPFLTNHLMSESEPLNALAANLEAAIEKHYTYAKKVFVRDLRREIVVSWADPEHRVVRVADNSSFEFVPFTYDDIVWKTERYASGELAMADYSIHHDEVHLNGNPMDGDVVMDQEGQRITKTYRIDVSEFEGPYRIEGLKDTRWPLDSDPTFEQSSPYVVQKCDLSIVNDAPGLRVVFFNTGGSDLFEPEGGAGANHKWDVIPFKQQRKLVSVPLLLPGQGYMLVMSRTLQGLDETSA